ARLSGLRYRGNSLGLSRPPSRAGRTSSGGSSINISDVVLPIAQTETLGSHELEGKPQGSSITTLPCPPRPQSAAIENSIREYHSTTLLTGDTPVPPCPHQTILETDIGHSI